MSELTGIKQEMIKKICVRDQDNILDIGCGTGEFLDELTKWRDAVGYGLDLSEENIEKATKMYPDLHFSVGTSENLSAYEDDMFRIVTVSSAFANFPDQQEFIKDVARILAPGGRFYIGEFALPGAVRVARNIVAKVLPSKERMPSTYEFLDMFKKAGLSKFRVHQKKNLLLVSAKKPTLEELAAKDAEGSDPMELF
ncbi:MAG: class I SAM-dependent methyltransferase [Anaerostipes sp.]|nr:class I SAM-dependent methyltransferase [Anaerostipes sp.]MDD3745904.1 class I SAM-dependent methyltransferase [Anaerostipes sp.]